MPVQAIIIPSVRTTELSHRNAVRRKENRPGIGSDGSGSVVQTLFSIRQNQTGTTALNKQGALTPGFYRLYVVSSLNLGGGCQVSGALNTETSTSATFAMTKSYLRPFLSYVTLAQPSNQQKEIGSRV